MLRSSPTLHPGETVHSGLARLSALLECHSDKGLVKVLFRKSTITAVKDLPAHLQKLVSCFSKGIIPSPATLINRHTLFPFFAAFHTTAKREAIRQQMLHAGTPYLAFGLMAASCPYPKWLRYCPRCAEEDRRNFGETYWHRDQQVPGITACAIHGIHLQKSTAQYRNERNRHKFVDAESSVPQAFGCVVPCCDVEVFMAIEAKWLLDHPEVHLPPEMLRRFFLQELNKRGLANCKGHVRLSRLKAEMLATYGAAFLTRIGCSIRDSVPSWIPRIFGTRPRRQHPVRYLLICHFLGKRLATLQRWARNPADVPFGSGPWPCLNRTCKHHGEDTIHAIVIQTSNNARSVQGTFVCEQCGMTYTRLGPDHSHADRWRKYKIPSYGKVWEDLLNELWGRNGVSLQGLARKLGVDTRTVLKQARRLGLLESATGVSAGERGASLSGDSRQGQHHCHATKVARIARQVSGRHSERS